MTKKEAQRRLVKTFKLLHATILWRTDSGSEEEKALKHWEDRVCHWTMKALIAKRIDASLEKYINHVIEGANFAIGCYRHKERWMS